MSGYVTQHFIKGLVRKTISLNNVLDVYVTDKIKKSETNLDNSLSKIKKTHPLTKIGTINGINIDTVDEITRLPSEKFYEALAFIPASAYIFSYKCPSQCQLKNDWEYEQFIQADPVNYQRNNNEYLPPKTFNSEYWQDNYDFKSTYNSSEYDAYNIDQTPLSESISILSADECSFSAAGSVNGKISGEGCLVGYKNMPLIYYEFDRKHEAYGSDTMIIDFSPKGMVEVK